MGWPNGDDWTCKGFAAFRNMNAFAAWMALGFVAFSRYETYLTEIKLMLLCLDVCAFVIPSKAKLSFLKIKTC